MKDNYHFLSEDITKSERYLHTPSKFARDNLLYIQEAGKLKSLVPHRCVREHLDSYLFLTVISGKGRLIVGNRKYEMSYGDCAFIDCMEHYEHISEETDGWELAWVHFNGFAAKGYYNLFEKNTDGSQAFKAQNPSTFCDIVEKLMMCQEKKDLLSELYSGEYLLKLVNCIIEQVTDGRIIKQQENRSMLIDAREYINENYSDERVLCKLIEKVGVNNEELDESFSSFFGIGLNEYVWNRRLNGAKELLRFSVKSLKEISDETGIASVEIMKKMFLEKEKMSPEEYRKKWAQWVRK